MTKNEIVEQTTLAIEKTTQRQSRVASDPVNWDAENDALDQLAYMHAEMRIKQGMAINLARIANALEKANERPDKAPAVTGLGSGGGGGVKLPVTIGDVYGIEEPPNRTAEIDRRIPRQE